MAGSFGAAKAAGDRIFALLDAEEELPDAEHGVIPKERSGSCLLYTSDAADE